MAATEEIEKEILAEMAANPVPYAAGQVNDVITIDGETRMISVPASEIFFGVESDKDVERKHFRCPKVVGDGIDLSKHQIYISYITSDSAGKTFSGNAGLYLCEDVATDGDDITFSWQLSGNVFASAGFIAFKVLAAKTDGENVQTRWNTVPAIGTVLMTVPDGMDIGEAYPDIVTQLLERMASVEKIATEEAMQGYVNTYLEAHPGEIDETLTDPKKAAPASVVGELKEDLDNNIEMVTYGETMLDMKWQQGYWYSIKNGEYNVATPKEKYVACKYKIDGDGSTLIATKQNGLGFTMFVCEYDLNDVFIKGYQYGNTVLNMTLDKGKKYAFSVSSSASVTVESVTTNYTFFKHINIAKTNKKLKDYIDYGNIYYIGATREITTLKEGLKKACEKKNSIVYVDAGIYDIIQEYGNDYFENYSYLSDDCGIVLKNNVNVIFSPNAKVLCNYTGDNHDIMFYFSPFNVGVGGFRVENLNIECSRVRYCIHDDLGMFGNSHDFTKTEYQNCNMYLDNSQNTARQNNNCIGGGLPYNGEIIINGCIFESTAVPPYYGGVDYHQNGENGAKSKSLITNCYFKGRVDRYSCSNLGQTKEISTVIVTNCSSGRTEGYAKNEQYSDSIYFLAWNNIRRPD